MSKPVTERPEHPEHEHSIWSPINMCSEPECVRRTAEIYAELKRVYARLFEPVFPAWVRDAGRSPPSSEGGGR